MDRKELFRGTLVRLRRSLYMPLLIWAFSWLMAGLAAGTVDVPWPDPASFHRKDSHLYLSIARDGYTLFPCQETIPKAPPNVWCGNAGWFPGYPCLVGAIQPISGSLNLAGVLISGIGTFAFLVVLWNAYLGAKATTANLHVMLLAGLFPGGIYYHAIFPLSVFLALALLCLWLYRKGHFLSAGTVGMAAAFTYPTGFLLGGASLRATA